MKQKYIVRKIKRFSGLGAFFWLLYRHDPEDDTYHLEGRFATLGQLMCAIGCEELENWHFLRQQASPGGHATVTCYNYVKTLGSCNVEIGVDVIEKSEAGWSRNETDDQICFKLSPAELHKVLFLLHRNRAELQNELGDSEKPINTRDLISLVDEVASLDYLSAKLNQRMHQYLEDHPNDTHALLN